MSSIGQGGRRQRPNVRLEGTLVLLVVALGGALFVTPAAWLVMAWLSDSYYSHGFLVPLISLFLVWRLRMRLVSLPSQPVPLAVLLLAACLALAAECIWRQAYFVACLAFVGCLGATALYLRGWAWARLLAFPFGYLLFMVPLPFVNDLAIELQVVASTLAAALAGIVGVPVQQQGAAVSIPGASFVVGLACSGLNSLIALLVLGALLAYLLHASSWAKLALLLLVVPIAVLANEVRIASLLWVAQHFGNEAGIAYHDLAAGYLSWTLTLVLMALVCKLLRCQLTPAASV